MPAVSKVTAAERRQIRRRRAAGETCTSIARDLSIGHQRVSSIDREERQREESENATAAAEREQEQMTIARWRRWTVTFEPGASGPLYPSPEYRLDYWWRHSGSYVGWLNYHDARRGMLLKDEVRALESGRLLFPRPAARTADSESLGH